VGRLGGRRGWRCRQKSCGRKREEAEGAGEGAGLSGVLGRQAGGGARWGGSERSPLELRRLLLSGEVAALRSGEGSLCVAEAARVAFPLRMSMTCGKRGVIPRPHLPSPPSLSLSLLDHWSSGQGPPPPLRASPQQVKADRTFFPFLITFLLRHVNTCTYCILIVFNTSIILPHLSPPPLFVTLLGFELRALLPLARPPPYFFFFFYNFNGFHCYFHIRI
jgi:hypothetical protein